MRFLVRVLILVSTFHFAEAAQQQKPCVLKEGYILGGLGGTLLPGMQPACEPFIRAYSTAIPQALSGESYWTPSLEISTTFIERFKQQGFKYKKTIENNGAKLIIMDKKDYRIYITSQNFNPNLPSSTGNQGQAKPLLSFQLGKH